MHDRWRKIRKSVVRSLIPVLRAFFPPQRAARVVTALGKAEYTLVPGTRVRFDRAVERWGHHFGRRWDVARLGRELAGNELRWQTRDLLLDGLNDHQVGPMFRVAGREFLDSALAEKRGVILLGNHYGAHLLPAHWLLREGYPLRLYMERPRHVSRFLAQSFKSGGPLGQDKLFISRRYGTTEAAGSILRAARVLKAGLILNLAGDVRWSGAHTAPATFLGQTHTFSATWVALAAMTRSPVVPVFCSMTPAGSYQLQFLEPFHVPPDAIARGEGPVWVQRSLDQIEECVSRDPANSNEYASWTEPISLAATAV